MLGDNDQDALWNNRSRGVLLVLLIVNLIGLCCPIAQNVHKGMIDKDGDEWFGYELVVFGCLVIMGLPFAMGMLCLIVAAQMKEIDGNAIVGFLIAWVIYAPLIIWTLFADTDPKRYGFYLVSLPPILSIIPILIRYIMDNDGK
ncbi:MAG: hypothetical protein K8U03_14265 [Planctomycetia bacterium]|nr:hypothetical protein [Planctomycetia bacterium]